MSAELNRKRNVEYAKKWSPRPCVFPSSLRAPSVLSERSERARERLGLPQRAESTYHEGHEGKRGFWSDERGIEQKAERRVRQEMVSASLCFPLFPSRAQRLE